MEKIIIYTDGGSRGNPGEAAIGVVIKNEKGETLKKYGEAIGRATNNEAEYNAAIFALKKVKRFVGGEKTAHMALEIRMDSELVARQLSGVYKIEEEKLFRPFITIWNLKMNFGKIVFRHIPREQNKEADRLLNEALDAKTQKELI